MAVDNIAAKQKELILTRIFDAPRELVFRLWTDPQHLAKWWGPKDYTNPECELDLRPGGAMRIVMRAPDGGLNPTTAIFREVVEPQRLVFSSTAFPDENGNPKLEVLHTVTFETLGNKTRLTLRAQVIRMTPEVAEAVGGQRQGWTESLDRLEELIEKSNS